MIAATEVGVEVVLPAWALLIVAIASGLATVLGTLHLVGRTLRPLAVEVRGWMATNDLVAERAPRWDQGLAELAGAQTELAGAVRELAAVTRTLGRLRVDIAAIREHAEHQGVTLAEVIDKWGELDGRLGHIEAQADRIADQTGA